ncbi:type I glyceraldehyde-3-phosphate dehydrogenase [Candidatus Chlorohelix allophototropha]|nr:type I glyceraldehyde-3-phosphate dehydrogenase [Chloroflexota bacterium L227-S17]
MRIGINGFGRIGRLIIRSAIARGIDLDIVAINDRGEADINAHMLQYDSTYGPFAGRVEVLNNKIVVNGHPIEISSHTNPLEIPWKDYGVDLVIESTGVFTNADKAAAHIQAGAERVLITAPSNGADITIVMGVNETDYHPDSHEIVSAASCTTNALAPVANVLHREFGIRSGMMSTIHSYTNDQRILDRSHKDPRRARAGAANIIPTSTGATKALGTVIPALAGRLNGMSYRVPTLTVSLVDLAVNLERKTNVKEINKVLQDAAEGELKGIMGFTNLELVSSDFRGDSHSGVVDGASTAIMESENLARIVVWYDNEWGYASRIVDLAAYIQAHEGDAEAPHRTYSVEKEGLDRALVMGGFAPESPPL